MRLYFIGTSGYNYVTWSKFYPYNKNKLVHYSQYLNSVEINSTYYYFYNSTVWRNWFNITSSSFKFSIKAHRTIMNTNNPIKLQKYWSIFWKNAKILGEKMSCILFQFNSHFKNNKASLHKLYLLKKILPKSNINYVFEFRDISWYNDNNIIKLFERNKWIFCFTHVNNKNKWINSFPTISAFYPPINIWNNYIINNVIYLRLHGNDDKYIGKYDKSFLKFIFLHLNGSTNFVYFNNTDIDIDALLNAQYLLSLTI